MPAQPTFGHLGADLPLDAPFSDSPFRLAVLADFSGRANRGLAGTAEDIAARKIPRTDRGNLDAVMEKTGVRLRLPLDDGGTADLTFQSLDDFHPDALFKSVGRFDELDDRSERSNLMTALLHHPDFRTVEGAWRGLDWLLRRVQKDRLLQVVPIDLSLAELEADLTASDDLEQSGLYQLLVEKGIKGPKGEPWAAVVGDYLFQPNAAHADLLGRLARIARLMAAPFLSSIDCRVAEAGFEPEPDAPAAWAALRKLPESALLGLGLPRFLLRPPYGESTLPVERFGYEEFDPAAGRWNYLWGNFGLATAALLAQSFGQHGWAMRPGTVLDLPEMPMHTFTTEDDDREQVLGELWMNRETAERAYRQGFMALLSVRNRDAMQVARFCSLKEPPKGQPPSELPGRWGQADATRLPRSDAPPRVSVAVGLSVEPSSVAAPPPPRPATPPPPPTPSPAPAPKADAVPPPAAPVPPPAAPAPAVAPEPAPADEGLDPELAALLNELSEPAAPPAAPPPPSEPEPAPADEGLDPELAALLKELGGEEPGK